MERKRTLVAMAWPAWLALGMALAAGLGLTPRSSGGLLQHLAAVRAGATVVADGLNAELEEFYTDSSNSSCVTLSMGGSLYDVKTCTVDTEDAAVIEEPQATASGTCLRLFHVNDIYIMDNLPALQAHVEALDLHPDCDPELSITLTTLGGDFLAPSLMSTIDHGEAMVAALNAIGVDVAILGNHECDIPMSSLQKRVDEFQGTWINTNMPGLDVDGFVPHHKVTLPDGRRVLMLGLLTDDKNLYREDSFGGLERGPGGWEPVEASLRRVMSDEALLADVDLVLPLTHMALDADIRLAEAFDLPLILGGHDHYAVNDLFSGTRIVKAAADAKNVAVVDIIWDSNPTPGANPMPKIAAKDIWLKLKKNKGDSDANAGFLVPPNAQLKERIAEWQRPAEMMRAATVLRFDVDRLDVDVRGLLSPDAAALSSVGARRGPSTMGTLIATALRESCGAEGALVNAGNVRGDEIYADGRLTFGDLNRECPFPSQNIVIRIDPGTLAEAIRVSRKTWIETPGADDANALHTDLDLVMDSSSSSIEQIQGEAPQQRLYRVVVDTYVLHSSPVLSAYAKKFPERIPAPDTGKPALPLLLRYFCFRAWRDLVDVNPNPSANANPSVADFFRRSDADKNGTLDVSDVVGALRLGLGEDMATPILAQQMLNILDGNNDGQVNLPELTSGLSVGV